MQRVVKTVNNIEFSQIDTVGKVPDLANGGRFTEIPLIQRIDPIFKGRARFVVGAKLQPEVKVDVSELTKVGGFCPFCPGAYEKYTFPFPSEMVAEGRIRVGNALVVPNILAYSTYSSVGIYDTSRHFVPIDEFDHSVVGNAFLAMVRHARAIRDYDHKAVYGSINANYLPSSGSSLIHPHLQSSHDYMPLSHQGHLIQEMALHKERFGRSLMEDLVEAEIHLGERYVGSIGNVAFFAPFAPSGFREVWGVILRQGDIPQIDPIDLSDLALGISKIISAYANWNLSSFNFALTGGGPDAREISANPLFRIVARSNPESYYRSDVTYFEKLYSELMVDVTPEETASALRAFF